MDARVKPAHDEFKESLRWCAATKKRREIPALLVKSHGGGDYSPTAAARSFSTTRSLFSAMRADLPRRLRR